MTKEFDQEDFFSRQFTQASQSLKSPWQELKQAQIFLTGGTGFFGKWLLELISWANRTQNAQIEVQLLTRSPESFQNSHPKWAQARWLTLVPGDVLTFEFPKKEVSHVIHAATSASVQLNREQPRIMVDTIVQGTRRVLDFAKHAQVKRLLLTSSGGTYGAQPPLMSHFPETYTGGPDPLAPDSAYGEGKRLAELLCSIEHYQWGLESVIARCFAFAGPYLPLDTHFAIGNLIRDAMKGDTLYIQGDGTPHRSYLYGADLAYWLFTLLVFGQPIRAYHVGSEDSLSIREIAQTVAQVVGKRENRDIGIHIAKEPIFGAPPAKYVPSTQRAREELGLKQNFTLEESVELTLEWHRRTHSGTFK